MSARKKPAKATTKATAKKGARRAPRAPNVDPALTPADELTDEIRRFITQRLAMYDTPSEVVAAVNEEYQVTISRQQAQHYDPTVGRKPAQEWQDIFTATRAAFLEETAKSPAAERAVRVRRLERMALAAERMRNYQLAATLYEQIAKDCGDAYTNRHKLEGPQGGAAALLGVTVEIHNDGKTATEVIT